MQKNANPFFKKYKHLSIDCDRNPEVFMGFFLKLSLEIILKFDSTKTDYIDWNVSCAKMSQRQRAVESGACFSFSCLPRANFQAEKTDTSCLQSSLHSNLIVWNEHLILTTTKHDHQ